MYRLGIDIGGTKINVGIVSYDREKAGVVALCKLEVDIHIGSIVGFIDNNRHMNPALSEVTGRINGCVSAA